MLIFLQDLIAKKYGKSNHGAREQKRLRVHFGLPYRNSNRASIIAWGYFSIRNTASLLSFVVPRKTNRGLLLLSMLIQLRIQDSNSKVYIDIGLLSYYWAVD